MLPPRQAGVKRGHRTRKANNDGIPQLGALSTKKKKSNYCESNVSKVCLEGGVNVKHHCPSYLDSTSAPSVIHVLSDKAAHSDKNNAPSTASIASGPQSSQDLGGWTTDLPPTGGMRQDAGGYVKDDGSPIQCANPRHDIGSRQARFTCAFCLGLYCGGCQDRYRPDRCRFNCTGTQPPEASGGDSS